MRILADSKSGYLKLNFMLCFSSALLLVKGLLLFLFSFLTGSDENFAQTGKPGNTFIIYLAAYVFFFSVKKSPCSFML